MWTSRAMQSDVMLLLARTVIPEPPRDQSRARTQALTLFLVDMRNNVNCGKGIDVTPVETSINHSTCSVFFNNFRVPATDIIGEAGNGFKTVLRAMNAERVLIAAECIGEDSNSCSCIMLCRFLHRAGDGRFFIDRSTRYANERSVFGRPIGVNQGISFPIADAYAQLEAASLMVNLAADRIDQDLPCGEQANLAKYLAAEASVCHTYSFDLPPLKLTEDIAIT